MKDMIIAFSVTTAVIVGAVLYYRRKNRELEKKERKDFLRKKLKEELLNRGKFSQEERRVVLEGSWEEKRELYEEWTDEILGGKEKKIEITEKESEPSPPIEGFQGLPDKAPIDDIAKEAIQSYKAKKYPANRRRKKRSGK